MTKRSEWIAQICDPPRTVAYYSIMEAKFLSTYVCLYCLLPSPVDYRGAYVNNNNNYNICVLLLRRTDNIILRFENVLSRSTERLFYREDFGRISLVFFSSFILLKLYFSVVVGL